MSLPCWHLPREFIFLRKEPWPFPGLPQAPWPRAVDKLCGQATGKPRLENGAPASSPRCARRAHARKGRTSPPGTLSPGDVRRPRLAADRDKPWVTHQEAARPRTVPRSTPAGPGDVLSALGGAALTRPHLPSFPGLWLQKPREEAAGRHGHLRSIRWGCPVLKPEP